MTATLTGFYVQVRTNDDWIEEQDCADQRDWQHDDGRIHYDAMYATREAAIAAIPAELDAYVQDKREAYDEDEAGEFSWRIADGPVDYDNGHWIVFTMDGGEDEGRVCVREVRITLR